MKKTLWILVVAIVIIIVGIFYYSSSLQGNISENSGTKISDNMKTVFVITGENFEFVMNEIDNPEIRVKKGDTVRIEFTSTQGFHDWVVDEFNAKTKQVKPENGLTTVEFIADKKGTFEYYCSVGQHRANGMKGNLIVE